MEFCATKEDNEGPNNFGQTRIQHGYAKEDQKTEIIKIKWS